MPSSQKSTSKKKKSKADMEWENRILCSDGNCIGIIGPDGRCKECKRPYKGRLPEGFTQDVSESEDAGAAEATMGEDNDKEPLESQASQTDPTAEANSRDDSDWEKRVLCSDGNCIGVIGSDGNCKECGKPYDPDAAD
jgi:hypothetical protein